MLNPEAAQAQLKKIVNPHWRSQRVQAIAELSEPLRSIGYGLLGYGPDGKLGDYTEKQLYGEAAFTQLETLSDSDRAEIFTLFFPKWATLVEAAWQFHSQLTYQISYSRRSFRAPYHPEYHRAKRHRWLTQLLQTVEGYDQDLEWFAAWTPYLYYGAQDALGVLFAVAINQKNDLGQTIAQILRDSAQGDHEIGAMGRHVTRGLLVADDPEGWAFIERLLLAAQRQEGLRQTILETIDEAHPVAFQRMLQLIVAENLTRFSAVIRAVDVWFGFELESLNEKLAKQILTQVSQLLEDEKACQKALQSSDPQTVYLALWSLGFYDAIAAIPHATKLLQHPEATHRFVAVYFLSQLDIPPATIALLPALNDRDLTVATYAVQSLHYRIGEEVLQSNAFEQLAENLPRFPAKATILSPLVWEWIKPTSSQTLVATVMVDQLGNRSPKLLIPVLSLLEGYQRSTVAEKLANLKPWDAEIRSTLFGLVGDSSQWVRESVIKILQGCQVTPEEILHLEKLLTRKASDLRRGILGLLLNQPDAEAIAAGQRLLQAKQAPQRQAGLELLRELVQRKRLVENCRSLAQDYQTQRTKLTLTEQQLLNGILETENKEATLTDALGLVDPITLTPLEPPIPSTTIIFQTNASQSCLKSLDELIHDHRQTPVKYKNWQGEQEELLANMTWGFPWPSPTLSQEENLAVLPLADVWENWWQQRSAELRDEDRFELLRAILPDVAKFNTLIQAVDSQDLLQSLETSLENFSDDENETLRYPNQMQAIVRWLLYFHPPEKAQSFLLDALATVLRDFPLEKFQQTLVWQNQSYWGIRSMVGNHLEEWVNLLRQYQRFSTHETENDLYRWWQLLHWIDIKIPPYRPSTQFWDVYNVYQIQKATEADLIFHLLGVREQGSRVSQPGTPIEIKANLRTNFQELSELTRRKLSEEYGQHPFLLDLADRCRQRILSVELQRGDLPTAATQSALALRSITGIPIVIQLIQALGSEKLARGYNYGNLSKSAVFSHLMRVSFPAPEDTPAEFSQRVASAQITTEKLIQFAFYAPQWVNYIEQALEWPGFADAVWWIHAHTKDTSWSVDQDVRETWEAQISERTPLSSVSLMSGAVDVAWFLAVYKRLKQERWKHLYDSAQYASSGIGHQRAKLFADAMLGDLDGKALRDRITTKRHQDSVRALGLLPLPRGKKREAEILNRYQVLQEFLRGSKQFGSQRQASEKLAVEIGLENLARTAGFVDPQRLQWAMEAAAIADLAQQAQVVAVDEVSVSLAINASGEPEISITKQGKPLKAIPAKVKKNPQIQAITTRKQDINKQASRMRISLEQAMCRGDRFTAEELVQLAQHPVLSPMLTQLVLIGEQEMGYLVEQGTALQQHNVQRKGIQSSELRIAHPADLLQSKDWHLWQQDCFAQERSQPFKQVFRELYVLTSAEQSEKISRRYEGHQVNPRQAIALFGQRGWIAAPEEGVRRTFHQEGLIAEVEFLNGFYTPLEVEGLTIAGVRFYRRDEWDSIPLKEIPPALFSEAMRDLDLVVSVAHQGGVDPEATASTVEMRASIVRETCRLMKFTNVQIQGNHVLIEGHLGSYSIHLGSAMVHRQPGGALCIIPVPSQHRGRIFLPFVDNDPKTAEVVSKVLLLSEDKKIQDPTILSQILG
jgi:HEAT repeat protein